MPDTTITAQIHEPLDIHRYLSAQITFHNMFLVNHLTNLNDFLVGQFRHTPFPRDANVFTYLSSFCSAYAMNIRQGNFNSFICGNIDTSNSRHAASPRLNLSKTVLMWSGKNPHRKNIRPLELRQKTPFSINVEHRDLMLFLH
jgi:hypothetical protein